jgi:hypothetical protein
MHRLYQSYILSLLLLLALAGAGLARPDAAAAQERTRCFPETGQCVCAVQNYVGKFGSSRIASEKNHPPFMRLIFTHISE